MFFLVAGGGDPVEHTCWVALKLPKGEHTLHFEAALCDSITNEVRFGQQDITYHLRVD